MIPGDSSPDAASGETDLHRPHEPLPATEEVLAGFCHDLNGQLASALGFVYLLPSTAGLTGPVEHLTSSLEQIEALVRRLRGMVRDERRQTAPASLAELLDALGELLRHHRRFEGATLQLDAPDDLPAVRVDFASALRVLLLAIDAGAAGAVVDRIGLGIEEGTHRVRVTIESTGTGVRGAAGPLVREAREAGIEVGLDPEGRAAWLEMETL